MGRKKITENKLPTVNKRVYKNLAMIEVTKNNDLEVIDFFLQIGAKIINIYENRKFNVVIYIQKPEKKE